MLTYKPGMLFFSAFATSRFDTGAASDADSLPVAEAIKNGIVDVAFTFTVAKISTGRYIISGTIPLTYTTNDVVQISVSAIVGGISGSDIVSEFIIEEVSGANVVTITAQEIGGTPIPDVSIFIFNSAETIKLKSGMTDVDGHLAVALNDGSYKIRLGKAMVNFTVPETLTVAGTTAKTCVGVPVSVTAPSAGLQTVIIYPTTLGLVYSPTMVFTAVIMQLNTVVDTAVLSNQILAAEDHTTHFEMQLAKGAVVMITGKNGNSNFFKKEITIDTDDTKNLTAYL
jgi:hypothetical protein